MDECLKDAILAIAVYLPEYGSILMSLYSDDPGSVVGLTPSTKNELWKLRPLRTCVCIYTFGYVSKDVFVKVNSSTQALQLAYTTLEKMGYGFINAFNFDIKQMAVAAADVDKFSHLIEKKRLGNFGSGMFMKLTSGCMFVDSIYTAMKTSRPGQWNSFGLAHMAKKLSLPEKMDVDGMMIKESEEYDVMNMLDYNARDSDLHAWVAKQLKMCEHLCTYAGLGKA
ncbi:hypothetical protein EsH8_XV_000015 [Colletotrichum jinshuiense]